MKDTQAEESVKISSARQGPLGILTGTPASQNTSHTLTVLHTSKGLHEMSAIAGT